eukprot:712162-Prymnesium_polylepis.3
MSLARSNTGPCMLVPPRRAAQGEVLNRTKAVAHNAHPSAMRMLSTWVVAVEYVMTFSVMGCGGPR